MNNILNVMDDGTGNENYDVITFICK